MTFAPAHLIGRVVPDALASGRVQRMVVTEPVGLAVAGLRAARVPERPSTSRFPTQECRAAKADPTGALVIVAMAPL